jgi:hypothetical protein
MTIRNILLVCCSAAFGAVFVLASVPKVPVATEKAARLGGSATETAFLPERFGVPHPAQ